jgi:ribosome-associated protein
MSILLGFPCKFTAVGVPSDISSEITFRTARSGGKGGQNVNKVETMVEGYLNISESGLLTPEQKAVISIKLQNRINSEGFLQVRSQVHRSQLSNKAEVVRKMNVLISGALKKEKPRISTKPSKASRAKRLDAKKIASQHKQNRQKIRNTDSR